MDSRKEKDAAVEIGDFYAIIGKDGREYTVEVLGKRVIETDTDVYVHYEHTVYNFYSLLELAMGTDQRSGEIGLDGSTRSASAHGHHGHDHDDEEVPRVRNVEWILYAGYDIATWYYSPFPEEYQDCQRLFICEYCLKYIRQVESFMNHTKNCKRKKPPGTVVYSKGVNKIYKVDGKTNKLYCQNLSLLAKLFLDNKTLYFDIHGFHFFVLTETRIGDRADVPVGFFSKEIVSYDGYNLACILILPPFQRKSYGKLLIEFSYELTKIEGKVGSPEKPLSDLGKLGYVSYWITAILRELYPRPWPAKRILAPITSRRRSKTTPLKYTHSDPLLHTPQEEGASSDSKGESMTDVQVSTLPDLRTQKQGGPGPMDVDPNVTITTAANDASCAASKDAGNKDIAFSTRELAAKTGIMEEDLLETLVAMGWMTYWQSLADQATSVTVKNAKRNYRKLMKFHEQQQLLEKYGGGNDFGVAGQHDSHDHESGLGSHARQHSRQQSGAHVSSVSNSNSGHGSKHSSAAVSHSVNTLQYEQHHVQLGQMTHLQLTQEVNPISILEIPDSDNEEGEEARTADEQSLLSATSGLKDVAIVTLEMVKDYQDRHNIRLDPYLDFEAIDWAAYRSTLE
ncbi:K(lysine) acetyltransferase [Dissophora ornata]|nr:K(lysine) acetyltransferase [Dissophora ornata]